MNGASRGPESAEGVSRDPESAEGSAGAPPAQGCHPGHPGEPPTPAFGLMLCDDLIFFSRVSATARAVGAEVRQARTAADVLRFAGERAPGGVVIDLHNPGLDLPALLAGLRAACPAMPRTVGFGSHVAADVLRAARQAGCDRVLPRSRFVEELETDLLAWLTPPPTG